MCIYVDKQVTGAQADGPASVSCKSVQTCRQLCFLSRRLSVLAGMSLCVCCRDVLC